MAAALEALILRVDPVERSLMTVLGPGVGLVDGYVLVPVTDDLHQTMSGDRPQPVMGFERLWDSVAQVAEEILHQAPVAYIHLEFHGGTGFQAAAVWNRGKITFGPRFTANHPAEAATDDYEVVGNRSEMAINQALRFLGVQSGNDRDEFAVIGLDRHRWTDDWAKAART